MANPIDLGDVVAGALAPVDPLEEYAEEIAAAERAKLEASAAAALDQARMDFKKYMFSIGYGGHTGHTAPTFHEFCVHILKLSPELMRVMRKEIERREAQRREQAAQVTNTWYDELQAYSQADFAMLEKYLTGPNVNPYSQGLLSGLKPNGKPYRQKPLKQTPTHPVSPKHSLRDMRYRK